MIEEDALTDGAWRPVGGIMRWFPALAVVAELRKVNVHDLIACPTCRCRVDETCRTEKGARRRDHDGRLAPRLCACGELVEPKHQLCETCRVESIRVAKRDYMRRRRSAYGKAA